ncbi:hypothetical protein RN001_009598 [Aquatica leii]|uniref:Glutathione S-transferase n=1 Tax=Aquatica leii TaxID=1421715 RepID=A0AAN7P5G6_9COLE|nr:hypothetical protein RN001_009598 [Aquatica leii]
MAPKLYMKYMSPPCRAVLTVARAIDLELEIIEVDDAFMRGPDILKLNPQHTIPILEDEDFILWESHAINAYLIGKYAKDDALYPSDLQQRAVIDQRMHFESGVLFPRFLDAFMPIIMGLTTQITDKCFERLDEACEFLNAFLEDRTWLAGEDVTVADASMLCTMTAIEMAIPIDSEKFPRLADWLQRGKELDFFTAVNEEILARMGEFIKKKLGM